jgi:hypothetical protein
MHRAELWELMGMQETVRAMNWVIGQGWALYWGTSEWSAEQLQEVSPQLSAQRTICCVAHSANLPKKNHMTAAAQLLIHTTGDSGSGCRICAEQLQEMSRFFNPFLVVSRDGKQDCCAHPFCGPVTFQQVLNNTQAGTADV